jgi:hypothetical protein
MPPAPTVVENTLVYDEEGDFWIEMDDMGVPLGRWVWCDDEEDWIFLDDMDVPLGFFPAGLPQTGLADTLSLYRIGLFASSFTALILAAIIRRKKTKNEVL